MIDKEFDEKCLQKRTRTSEPSVKIIRDEKSKQQIANQHNENSKYFLEGAKNLLNTNTPLLAVVMGYFAMEHKANQLLALTNYDVESHICTQIGLSRLIGRRDLAKQLSNIFDMRINLNYRMLLKKGEEEKANAGKVINGVIIPFVSELDNLIGEKDNHYNTSQIDFNKK